MLSVLIPVYNYDVTELVNELHKQLVTSGIDFEILIFDDGSKSEINNINYKLNQLENVEFKELQKNVGLSQNRNLLIKSSKFDYLILLDADSLLVDDLFIKHYLHAFKNNPDIVYGGLTHPKEIKPEQKLRWKYGRHAEEVPVNTRAEKPYKYMRGNNTAFHKRVFKIVNFDNSLTKYGHEDTLFAYQALLQKLNVLHIDNPVLHGDIDTNNIFIEKTEKGVENLLFIYNSKKIDADFVKILSFYRKIEKIKLKGILAITFTLFSRLIKKQLNSSKPSLFLFNFYKLSYMCYYDLNRKI
ncbi:glycosyltransferase family 2 protein [Pontimicrobium aquaticum]|uniref:Glycosyltransferase n=1 Tax=Pontimicrobium aquaticum TaxID=2565367 RepID=A0A4U0EWQ3_9FLAO|nr:glycosyltransferase family 2 protein [Pontimicrobium aquaticum]TJY36397.1 glycosyltransferase [Pontimicrobium aquaticum]